MSKRTHVFTTSGLKAMSAAVCLCLTSVAHADPVYMKLSTITAGTSGSFSGTLGGATVTGTLTANAGNTFQFNNASNSWESGVTDGTSQQFSYANVFTDSTALADTVGYTKFYSTTAFAVMDIKFSTPMTNLILQIANLDNSTWNFSDTAGLAGISLLSGNGGADGDGLGVSGTSMMDLNPATFVGQSPSVAPFVSPTGRSGYGSILLEGTYSDLIVDVRMNPNAVGGDGGNFTLVSIPEPGTLPLVGISMVTLLIASRRKNSRVH